MKLWQFLLFAVGCFLPVAVMPHPLPESMSDTARQHVWVVYAASGVAVSWLGSVGIWHLSTFLKGARQRRDGTGSERIAGRRETLIED